MNRIALISLLAVTTLGAAVVGAPKISVDNPSYDFGQVVAGLAVSHTFLLTNEGDEPLVITGVTTSCGCTTTALAKTTLAPGESVELAALVDTSGFAGAIAKTITVASNDPETSELRLALLGTVNRAEAYQLSAGDLNYLLYLLVNLREPEEYAIGHLIGAINVPYAELDQWTSQFPQGILIILYDQNGPLSDQAAQTLQQNGFPEARSLLGGLDEWIRLQKGKYILPSNVL